MNSKTSKSCHISIYIAGSHFKAKEICRKFCYDVGLCVTVTKTSYIYTGGTEKGVIIGLINYPRFPKKRKECLDTATKLGYTLMEGLHQLSFSIETPSKTIWYYNDKK